MFYKKQRQSASSLSALMDQTKDAMVCFTFRVPVDPQEPQSVIDAKLRDATVIEASNAFAQYFGFAQREDIIGQHLLDLFRGTIPEWFLDYGQEVEEQNFANIERTIEIPVAGEFRTMRIHMQNIFAKDLLVSQWITVRDVHRETERKRVIEQNEQLKHLAVEAVGLRTFSLRFDPSNNNEPHGAMTVSENALSSWWDQIHPEDKPQVEASFARFYAGETAQLHSIFRTSLDGEEEVWMESWAIASSRDQDGRPQDIIGVVMDRTESKALEAKLIAGQRLESLGVLAGGIAHDFNNLLMSVTGALDATLHAHPNLKSQLETIDEAARTATHLCDQLLTYAGRGSAELSHVNASQVLENMRELLRLSIDPKATLAFDIQPDCFIRGESSQIKQIAMNLAKNASDALAGQSGHIKVSLRELDYKPEWQVTHQLGTNLLPGPHICLAVQDDGCGMTDAQLERLFDPFFTTKFTGRGLGMAVVMGAVRGHGGAIHVQSAEQEGTTVSIVLPRDEASEATEPATPPPLAQKLTGRILVVDDEASVRTAVARLLSTLGIETVLSSGGEEAVALVESVPDPYSAIMIDVTMPGIDGVETASRILEREPDAKIIMCSGYSNVVMPPKLSAAVSFLQKPYRLAQLSEKLSPLLEPA